MVVSDLDDVFVPLPDDLLVNLSESRAVVDSFLDSLSTMFQGNVNVESAFGPALKAAFLVMVWILPFFLFFFLGFIYSICSFFIRFGNKLWPVTYFIFSSGHNISVYII